MANGVYWVGQDGNTYINAEGIPGGAQPWRAPLQTPQQMGLQRIADPNAPAPTPSGGGGGGGGASAPEFNEAGARNTQRTIDEIPGLLKAALATEGTRYKNAIKDFGAQEKAQRGTYTESTNTNQLNYDSNFMDSIRAGIKGLGGLMQLLRGTGASGGTADDQVRDVVGGITSTDIRTGADTQKENQTSLDSSLSTFLTDLDRKRDVNEDTWENNQRAVTRESNTQLQDLYGKMAGFYGDADRRGEYNDWMDKAGALTSKIGLNSRTKLSDYDTTPVVVKAPEITAFAGPSQPDIATAPSDGQVGSGIFTMSDRRRRESAPPLVPAGA